MHGRTPAGLLDYAAYFHWLSGTSRQERSTGVGDEVVAVPTVDDLGGTFRLRFVAGREGQLPLFFNPETGAVRTGDLADGELLASTTVAYVDPSTRFMVSERRRPGVSVNAMAIALSRIAREASYGQVTLTLHPVPAESFVEEIDNFSRIREARLVLSRPNSDWLDNAVEIAKGAEASDAETVEAAYKAGRGGSLKRDSGVVADLKQLARNPIGSLRNVVVRGTREGESRETSVSLERHNEKRFVDVHRDTAPSAKVEAVEAAALQFLSELAERSES